MVSGFGIKPGWHRQIGLPFGDGVQVVPGPQGEGTQGFSGRFVVLLTSTWIGETGGKRIGTGLDLVLLQVNDNNEKCKQILKTV